MIDRTVKFPQIGDVSSTQSYVLVGANGSGKVIWEHGLKK